MSEVKYTPAPWHLGGIGNKIVYDQSGYAICNCVTYHGEEQDITTQADNACLISAAPEMLQALEIDALSTPKTEEEHQELKNYAVWLGWDGTEPITHFIALYKRQAIAKATTTSGGE